MSADIIKFKLTAAQRKTLDPLFELVYIFKQADPDPSNRGAIFAQLDDGEDECRAVFLDPAVATKIQRILRGRR